MIDETDECKSARLRELVSKHIEETEATQTLWNHRIEEVKTKQKQQFQKLVWEHFNEHFASMTSPSQLLRQFHSRGEPASTVELLSPSFLETPQPLQAPV